MIVALIDDRALLVDLVEEVAVETGEAAPGGIREIDVGEPAAAQAIDGPRVALQPRRMAQRLFARDGLHAHLMRARHIGIRADGESDRPVGEVLEGLVEIRVGGERIAVDREQIVALLHLQPRLRQRRVELGIPAPAVVNVRNAVVAVFDPVVGPEQPDRDLVHLRHVAAADEHVTDREVAHHLAEEERQVIAARDAGQIVGELLLGGRQIQAVEGRVVEERPLHAPGIPVHLRPLFVRLARARACR